MRSSENHRLVKDHGLVVNVDLGKIARGHLRLRNERHVSCSGDRALRISDIHDELIVTDLVYLGRVERENTATGHSRIVAEVESRKRARVSGINRRTRRRRCANESDYSGCVIARLVRD